MRSNSLLFDIYEGLVRTAETSPWYREHDLASHSFEEDATLGPIVRLCFRQKTTEEVTELAIRLEPAIEVVDANPELRRGAEAGVSDVLAYLEILVFEELASGPSYVEDGIFAWPSE